MPNSNLQIRRITGSLGAEITGVDFLSLSESVFKEIHQALLDYEVLFFPGCALDDTTQMALAHRFGQPSVFPVLQLLGSTEPSFQVIEDGPDSPNEAGYWHTDVTWTAEPPKIALLRAGVMPVSGGDTAWASMSAAYEALSPAMQEIVCRLEVRHDNEAFIDAVQRKMKFTTESENLANGLRETFPPVTHPLVRTHPETGRRALLWGGHFMKNIVGMHPEESTALLGFLEQHIGQVRFQCRWKWTTGDLAIWDERSTVHQAVNDHFPARRSVHRCVVDGDRPYFDPKQTATPRGRDAHQKGPS